MAQEVFVFGVARGGTNLVGRMLSAHPEVALAFDPLLPVLRSFRDALALASADPAVQAAAGGPLRDFYGDPGGPAQLDVVLAGSLDLPLPSEEADQLVGRLVDRTALENPGLAKRIAGVGGATYAELVRSVLRQVDGEKEGARWVGAKEVWTIDFLPALARAFPDARFIAIERDPRGVMASLLGMGRRDPTQWAHPGSYLRHWRKSVALARHFQADPALAPRLLILDYERLAAAPADGARRICDHLGLSAAQEMLHPERLIDPVSGKPWVRNSSFEAEDGRIVTESVERWRRTLSADEIALADLYAGPELALLGGEAAQPSLDGPLLERFLALDRHPGSWRSDSGDVVSDLGFELLRWSLLRCGRIDDAGLVRRCFLFPWVHQRLAQGLLKT